MHVASRSGGPKVMAVATRAAISVLAMARYKNTPVGPKPESGAAREISYHIQPSTTRCARRATASHSRSEPADQANTQPILRDRVEINQRTAPDGKARREPPYALHEICPSLRGPRRAVLARAFLSARIKQWRSSFVAPRALAHPPKTQASSRPEDPSNLDAP